MHTALKNLWASVAIDAGVVLDRDRSGAGDLTLETSGLRPADRSRPSDLTLAGWGGAACNYMIDFACVSSTTPTWSNDPRWWIPGIAATEAEHAKLAADRASSAPVQGVHRYYPFVVEDRGRLGKSALTVVYIFAVLLATPDHVPCALPDPFSFYRHTSPEASVDVCDVLSGSPNAGSAPFLLGIRFEALRVLCSRFHLRGIAEVIANAEVPLGVAHFLSSATLMPLDKKFTSAERNAMELNAGDMKGSVWPIGIGSVLVRYAMCVLLRAHGDPIAQWLAACGLFDFGFKSGVHATWNLIPRGI
eukprot:jgi/Tetstr1/421472/TSEL_012421.t1